MSADGRPPSRSDPTALPGLRRIVTGVNVALLVVFVALVLVTGYGLRRIETLAIRTRDVTVPEVLSQHRQAIVAGEMLRLVPVIANPALPAPQRRAALTTAQGLIAAFDAVQEAAVLQRLDAVLAALQDLSYHIDLLARLRGGLDERAALYDWLDEDWASADGAWRGDAAAAPLSLRWLDAELPRGKRAQALRHLRALRLTVHRIAAAADAATLAGLRRSFAAEEAALRTLAPQAAPWQAFDAHAARLFDIAGEAVTCIDAIAAGAMRVDQSLDHLTGGFSAEAAASARDGSERIVALSTHTFWTLTLIWALAVAVLGTLIWLARRDVVSPVLKMIAMLDGIRLNTPPVTLPRIRFRELEDLKQAVLMFAAALQQARDLTRALRSSEDRYRGLVDTQLDLVARMDGDGRFTFVNNTLGRLLGRPAVELIGDRRWPEIVAPEDAAAAEAVLAEARDPELLRATAESRIAAADGIRWYAWEIYAIPGDEGTPLEIQAVGRDVTERHRRETDLRATLDELSRSNAELERFAYVASHDLKEPLRSIVSFSQLLERSCGDSLDRQGREYLGFVIDGARRMNALITDLLAYARVMRREIAVAPVDLEAALSTACDNLRDLIDTNGAVIRHDPLPVVVGNDIQLIELLQNLLSNALKFHRPDAVPTVEIRCRAGEGVWDIAVIDNGIGIERQYFDSIFEIYRRLHRENYPGTGIGLALCKRIVESHHGRIRVESQPGQGATFIVTLPAGATGLAGDGGML
ncbi:MAG: PAS domain S-box protein [Magnetospirillum sp.]|nr:PAS domain S-box protein [Magnetospirillum sp.]